ncbi:hypothetical protein DCC61_02300 [Candidatus Microgenomates bacterium]|nr:hypothetical protein [Candidatus Microgenomates bacterium CPR3]RIK51536.1 MAG: hypothetical protein DCC61_02300 [Candidatus Microgenomates bacterium]
MKSLLWYLVTYPLLVILMISLTGASSATIHDAAGYLETARALAPNPFSVFANPSPSFIDQGYPFLLAVLSHIVPLENITFYQVVNYLFWALSSLYVYKSLVSLKIPHSKFYGLLMLYSPLFLSFSAKLYSEPMSALGVSLLIWGVVSGGVVALALGTFLLVTVKSLFFPGVVLLALYYLYKRKRAIFVGTSAGLLISLPIVLSSYQGSRSLYNRAIQVSKTNQTYAQILSCSPYYISYPLGLALLPSYQGVCHQNDPTSSMPGYESNPYVMAEELRNNGFSNQDWIKMILANPLKYLLVMLVSLDNFLLFEGLYPTIITILPPLLMLPLFLLTRIILSLYLWYKVLGTGNISLRLLLPFFYLFFTVAHFQVEPRYIYPLIPYIYFLAGLRHNKVKL